MPAAYAISATSAYPDIDSAFLNAGQTLVAGPYVYGSQLVVTTDLGPGGATLLTYYDAATLLTEPMAGKLSVSVCVEDSRDFGD
jgi:fructose-1,6-bisphosphatase